MKTIEQGLDWGGGGLGRSAKIKEKLCEWGAVAVCFGHGRNIAKILDIS
jgi:hypothetical protein